MKGTKFGAIGGWPTEAGAAILETTASLQENVAFLSEASMLKRLFDFKTRIRRGEFSARMVCALLGVGIGNWSVGHGMAQMQASGSQIMNIPGILGAVLLCAGLTGALAAVICRGRDIGLNALQTIAFAMLLPALPLALLGEAGEGAGALIQAAVLCILLALPTRMGHSSPAGAANEN